MKIRTQFDELFLRNTQMRLKEELQKRKWSIEVKINGKNNEFKITYDTFDILSVHLSWMKFVSLFYYSAYFCYYLWVTLHSLELFMALTILFQLTFTFIYSTFSKISEFHIRNN